MNVRQWEVWKGRPPAFARDAWFVILSAPELCADARIFNHGFHGFHGFLRS